MDEIPRLVFERVAAAHPTPAAFEADEVTSWPVGALAVMKESALLKETDRAATLHCDGCEWGCEKQVVVRTPPKGGALRAFVNCNEEPDLGRIPIGLERLVRYRSTATMLVEFVARAVGTEASRIRKKTSIVPLTKIRGRFGPRPVLIGISPGKLQLKVGTHEVPLADFVKWSGGVMVIDWPVARRLANRKEKQGRAGGRYQPNRSAQQSRKRQTAQRDREIVREARRRHHETGNSWTLISEQIAKMPFAKSRGGGRLTPSSVRRIISREMSR
jgi:hypothetical protein